MKRSIPILGLAGAVCRAIIAIGMSYSVLGCANHVAFEAKSLNREFIQDDGSYVYQTSLSVSNSSQPLDLAWVIDSSGSMNTEINHVKANLAEFIRRVQNQADLKMALIAENSVRDHIVFPSTGAQFLHIAQKVRSKDALILTGAALCTSLNGICSGFNHSTVQGRLANFWRRQSKKVLIIVTDDESEIAETRFLDVFSRVYPEQQPSTFGFIGLGNDKSPCQAATGNRYMQMVKRTGGTIYNVCDEDWRASFSSMASGVVALSAPPVKLPRELNTIMIFNVTLDGRPLLPSQYTTAREGIYISPSLLTTGRVHEITVEYKLK
jgi:hypothetical protein